MDLPNRPRVLPGLPLLRRRDDVVQIGTDPRHAMLVEDVPEPMASVLLGLNGRHTLSDLRERLAGHGRQAAEFAGVLHGLAQAGLVEDSVPVPHPRLAAEVTGWALRTRRHAAGLPAARAARSVVVHGEGRLAVTVAALLAASGVAHVRVVARGRVGPEDTGSGYAEEDVGRPRAEAAQDAVRRACGTVRPVGRVVDLVVLADALVPAPELLHQLVSDGTPHLAVRVREGLGVVGPLVVPGRSSCLRCADRHEADADPAWPMIAAQLVDRVQHADLATVTATAGVAVGQALLALDRSEPAGTRPPTWDATLEVDAFAGVVEHRIAPVHPRCECRSAK
ncbi:bacteriocin biosynthesis cyclodehydratase domain-containing protein [Saccharothrix carnea]|uniref:Bacteriocin biosynthesis cyclodehydratase domain-containing protein n=1 Tax=Saccharothrix carnea TaxID=1280637 RepID=A0A2P8HYY9_SACCR|nr:ThiF family adenylyltransferase [Saccharothrix carnea]PSL51448.1 bacteriocin biosynthesis cyclodehydratase domain-containing protein [Saccharothrix carnea]